MTTLSTQPGNGLTTSGEIAKRVGCDRDRVNYAITRAGVEPTGRAGRYRLFGEDAVDRIVAELDRIGSRQSGDQ